MNNFFEKIKTIIKQFPFLTIFLLLFPVAIFSLERYCNSDRLYIMSEGRAQDQVLVNGYKDDVAKDTSKCAARLHNSILALKARKEGVLEDATYYYEGLFFYSLLLGILSILGSMMVVLLVKDGWTQTSSDVKVTLAIIFLACSIFYFMPKLINNEQNYKSNIAVYYVYSKQVVYSTNIITLHYCCDTSKNPEAMLRSTADSNYTVMANNLLMHYDMNTAEATNSWNEFKSGLNSKTGSKTNGASATQAAQH